MAKAKEQKPVEETDVKAKETQEEVKKEDEKEEEKATPTEEEIRAAKTPEDKLKLMKTLLANSKEAENVKQKKIYSAMPNIQVVRNY